MLMFFLRATSLLGQMAMYYLMTIPVSPFIPNNKLKLIRGVVLTISCLILLGMIMALTPSYLGAYCHDPKLPYPPILRLMNFVSFSSFMLFFVFHMKGYFIDKEKIPENERFPMYDQHGCQIKSKTKHYIRIRCQKMSKFKPPYTLMEFFGFQSRLWLTFYFIQILFSTILLIISIN